MVSEEQCNNKIKYLIIGKKYMQKMNIIVTMMLFIIKKINQSSNDYIDTTAINCSSQELMRVIYARAIKLFRDVVCILVYGLLSDQFST